MTATASAAVPLTAPATAATAGAEVIAIIRTAMIIVVSFVLRCSGSFCVVVGGAGFLNEGCSFF